MLRRLLFILCLTLPLSAAPKKPAAPVVPPPVVQPPAPDPNAPAKPPLAVPVDENPPAPPSPPPPPEIPDDGIRVSILGYHDFSETEKETEMKIRTSKFRQQMQSLKDMGMPVISMADFQAWKRGEKTIPQKSVLITMDDGWKAVYTDAYPVMKEFGYPFTIFLYKNYVDGGGRALTSAMIQEMQANGATIGSHSVSHPYPGPVKAARKKGPQVYDAYLRNEMGESMRFLNEKFDARVTTYAYPGGFHTEEMFPLAKEFGYTQLFTVIPGKIKRSSDDMLLPRYIVMGTHDSIFDTGVAFNETALSPQKGGEVDALPVQPTTPYPVHPEAGAMVDDRTPLLTADLSTVADMEPKSLVMRVSGFGEVPAVFDPDKKTFSWKINRPLRSPTCQVAVTWRDSKGKPPELPLRWTFRVDLDASYAPQE
jgi:peptidoglycan/xylan/chitin deacetylase (PgdA/CDA1 family)